MQTHMGFKALTVDDAIVAVPAGEAVLQRALICTHKDDHVWVLQGLSQQSLPRQTARRYTGRLGCLQ